MSADLISLADAASILGVSSERVRQLVAGGSLRGDRIGNAWAVRRDEVEARRFQARRRGRPLGARRAWAEILVGSVDLVDAGRYRERAEARRYRIGPADLAHLLASEDVLLGGAAGASSAGDVLAADRSVDVLYIAAARAAHLLDQVVALDDPGGSLVVMAVPEAVWAEVAAAAGAGEGGRRLAPIGAIALDLMASNDPRSWESAERLIGRIRA